MKFLAYIGSVIRVNIFKSYYKIPLIFGIASSFVDIKNNDFFSTLLCEKDKQLQNTFVLVC